jgi:hypothetical protein
LFFAVLGIIAIVYIFIDKLIVVGLIFFVCLEILAKSSIILHIFRSKYVLTSSDKWQDLEIEESQQLDRWTTEMLNIGFIQVGDYEMKASRYESFTAKVFFNDKNSYFGGIFKVGKRQLFCSLFLMLEQKWSLTVSNNSDPQLQADNYVFQRLPRHPFKVSPNISPTALYHLLDNLREDLPFPFGVFKITNNTAMTIMLTAISKGRVITGRRLLPKSMIWLLIEYWWFTSNPRLEWLGNYSKLKF